MRKLILYTIHCSLFTVLCAPAVAQTHIDYDLAAETAVGSGDYTAYQLATNRYHTLATRPNTAYLRGALNVEHALSKDFTLAGAVDAIASVHADHKTYLQQCYANLSYQNTFFLEVGSREEKPVVRDALLSSGSFVKGTNAKPIPQIHFGTNDFWTVPFTKDWLQVSFDFGYGKFKFNCAGDNVECTVNGKPMEVVHVDGDDYFAKLTEFGPVMVVCD